MVIFGTAWDIMDITEKEIYVKWHDYAYRDDLDSAETLIEKASEKCHCAGVLLYA